MSERISEMNGKNTASRRSLGMHARDTFANNTDYALPITDANVSYTFRAYVGDGYRRNWLTDEQCP